MPERGASAVELLVEAATERPTVPFLGEVDGRWMTYAEVHRRVRELAAHVREVGVAAGDPVTTMLPQSAEATCLWLAIAGLGAVEVAVNTSYQGRLLRYMLEDAGSGILVTTADLLPVLQPVLEEMPDPPRVMLLETNAGMAQRHGPVAGATWIERDSAAAGEVDLTIPKLSDPSCVLYTSGTTGPSKGVIMPWGQMHATADHLFPPGAITADDRYYCPYPVFHVSGKFPIQLMLMTGGRVLLREVFSTSSFWKDVHRDGITTTLLMGTMARFLMTEDEGSPAGGHPLDKVLMVPAVPEVGRFADKFGVRVCTVFNMTEISCPLMSDGWITEPTCGRPRPGVEVRIVDDEDQPVGPGEPGELVLRSTSPWTLMSGYWRKPEATLDSWRNLWFHTGDFFVELPDGSFQFVDRKKDAIRRRGENISSIELEIEVNEFPPVKESVAVAVPSEWGEDDVKICVVLHEGAQFDPAELVEFLRDRVARFAVPRYVEVVDQFPRTPTDKIRKAELRQRGVNASTWDREAVAPTRRQ